MHFIIQFSAFVKLNSFLLFCLIYDFCFTKQQQKNKKNQKNPFFNLLITNDNEEKTFEVGLF